MYRDDRNNPMWRDLIAVTGLALACLAVGLSRMALRRIRLDRSHLQIVMEAIFSEGQIPLGQKREKYVRDASDLLERDGASPSPLPVRVVSQHGEDMLLWDFFERRRTGTFIDVGAFDGEHLSNTYFLESVGWKGICIEPLREMAARCASLRTRSTVVQAAVGNPDSSDATIEFLVDESNKTLSRSASPGVDAARADRVVVPFRRLDDVVPMNFGPIDVVSIDVEGQELEVLQGFAIEHFRPAVFVIEDNSRGVDRRVRDYVSARGYRHCFTVGVNDFYVQIGEQRSFFL